jgi:hypothetical protein
MIEVQQTQTDDPLRFSVTITEGGGATRPSDIHEPGHL